MGASWLAVDAGLFLRSAVAVSVDPGDSAHLLLGTDIGLLRTRNGGRQWTAEALDKLTGPVTALAFSTDGGHAFASGTGGIYRWTSGVWARSDAPGGAIPARDIVPGAAPGRVYLLGRARLFVSDDAAASFRRVSDDLPSASRITSLAVIHEPGEVLFAVVDGRLMASDDVGRHWSDRSPGDRMEIVASDGAFSKRVWSAQAEQLFRSDDFGRTWQPVGGPLPDAQTPIRGIAADPSATVLVVTSHRGMYRSENGGLSWVAQEGGLPAHQEAGQLIGDRRTNGTLLAVYSLVPYADIWSDAVAAADRLARPSPWMVGAIALSAVGLLLGGTLVARVIVRTRPVSAIPGPST
jgi:photosystem II stability/assembly factor-like uncharacterized protein